MGIPGEPMARGPKKHLKRLNAPKHWMLNKMGGTWAPRPSTGPHKLRECLPLVLILRNRLKYRLNNKNFSKEKDFKLCRVQRVSVGAKGVPNITTHDGRTIRYPDPLAKMHDVVKVDIATGKAVDMLKFEVGVQCIVTKGQNQGRMGTVIAREKHIGSFEIVHVKDSKGRAFATRIMNIFTVSNKDDEPVVSVPRAKGLRDNILEERKKRLGY